VALDYMTFKTLRTEEKSGVKWNNIKPLVAVSDFRPEVYVELEDFFRHIGLPREADLVLSDEKHREWISIWNNSEGFSGYIMTLPKIVKIWLLKYLVGYGRHPEYAFYWSIVVIGFGCWVFRDKPDANGRLQKMEPRDPQKTESVYNPLAYSLDLFAPAM
jgi:hypothetical protein